MTTPSETLCVLSPRRLLRHVMFSIIAGGSVCIHGGAGVGKSEIVNGYGKNPEVKRLMWEQWAERTGKPIPRGPNGDYLDIRVVHYTIPQMSEESFEGVPRHIHLGGDDYATVAAPVMELRPRDGYPIILFLDEVKAADVRVQKVLLQLVLEKKIHNISLPVGTLVVMATNRAEDQAALRKMPFPLANRAWHCELGVSALEWIKDFAEPNGIHPVFRAFVREFGEAALLGYDPDCPADTQLTPRSFTDAARRYSAAESLGPIDQSEVQEIVFGCIGQASGLRLTGWLALREKLPTFEDIANHGDKAKLPDLGDISQGYYIGAVILERLRKPLEEVALLRVMDYLAAIMRHRRESVDAVGWLLAEVADRASGDRSATQVEMNTAIDVLNAASTNPLLSDRVTSFLRSARS